MINSVFRNRISLLAMGIAAATAFTAQGQIIDVANTPWFERPIGDGVVWRAYQFDNVNGNKQNINIIEIDLDNPNVAPILDFRPGPSDLTRTSIMGQQLDASVRGGGRVVGGVNGTFYNLGGTPNGGGITYLRVDGTTIHTQDANDGSRLYEGGIVFNDRTDATTRRRPNTGTNNAWATLAATYNNIMVNGPLLVEGGVVVGTATAPNVGPFEGPNPRTAVGKTADNKLLYVTIDGRQASTVSLGTTILETSQIMQALGCVEATNLDGGGSTTMWVKTEPLRNGVVNSFSDASERGVANGIFVLADPPTPLAFDARLNSVTYNSIQRAEEEFTVTVNYTNLGTTTWTPSNVTIVPSRNFGRTSGFIPAGQENSFAVLNQASVATGQTGTFTMTLTPPDVPSTQSFLEHFALWETAGNSYFGPKDNDLKVEVTVQPSADTTPLPFIVQGLGPNSTWYFEPTGGWGNSTVQFTAPGTTNGGSQRFCSVGASPTTDNRAGEFRPAFPVSGRYRIDVAYPQSDNNINSVTYIVNHANGSSTFTRNQKTGANTWSTLGEFDFTDTTTVSSGITHGIHNVRVTNGTVNGTSGSGNRFYSGAIRVTYISTSVDHWMMDP